MLLVRVCNASPGKIRSGRNRHPDRLHDLIGLATDNGVILATYLDQQFKSSAARSVAEVRERVGVAGLRRVRPCLMTTATTMLALLPVITSRGRGADVMVPMAVPLLGGMALALMALLVVPTLYALVEERGLADGGGGARE
jgi:Cu(I)/Ag(I) efflux system membrane protein CusA/SilA